MLISDLSHFNSTCFTSVDQIKPHRLVNPSVLLPLSPIIPAVISPVIDPDSNWLGQIFWAVYPLLKLALDHIHGIWPQLLLSAMSLSMNIIVTLTTFEQVTVSQLYWCIDLSTSKSVCAQRFAPRACCIASRNKHKINITVLTVKVSRKKKTNSFL